MKRHEPEIHSITTASTSRADEVSGRTKRYLFSMAVRTGCFVGAVVATGPLRWILLAGALFLPYVAVVIANTAKRSEPGSGGAPVTPEQAPRLDPGQHPPSV